MRGTLTSDFMIFVVTLIILVVIMSSAFGKGVMYHVLGFFALSQPAYLAKEFSTFATAAAHMPGDVEFSGVGTDFARDIELTDNKIVVTDPASKKSCTIPYARPPDVEPKTGITHATAGKKILVGKSWNTTISAWELWIRQE